MCEASLWPQGPAQSQGSMSDCWENEQSCLPSLPYSQRMSTQRMMSAWWSCWKACVWNIWAVSRRLRRISGASLPSKCLWLLSLQMAPWARGFRVAFSGFLFLYAHMHSADSGRLLLASHVLVSVLCEDPSSPRSFRPCPPGPLDCPATGARLQCFLWMVPPGVCNLGSLSLGSTDIRETAIGNLIWYGKGCARGKQRGQQVPGGGTQT